jgi:hypothetical protein
MVSDASAEKAEVDFEEFAQSDNGVAQSDTEEVERCAKERAVVRKLDLFIAPVMMMLQLISYLDRGNIGFASTQGMTTDINLQNSDLNVCLVLFLAHF